jgi:SAM-dependent methyltransferase
MREVSLTFPPPAGCHQAQWTGSSFLVDGRPERILAYGAGKSGWSDDLTELHESASDGDHFIDVASRAHAMREARRVTTDARAVVLEVGVSSGFLLAELAKAFPEATVLGADYTYGTLQKLATRFVPAVPLLQFDLTQCPLPSSSVDTAVLLNVLEHIERDDLAVAQLHRMLKPNGVAIIEVPASQRLFDSYDRALMHWRRYQMSGLVTLFRSHGFAIERRSHLGFFMYPGFFAAKTLGKNKPVSDEQLQSSVKKSISWTSRLGVIADSALSLEAALRERVYLPFGIRCLVTARKIAR